MRKSSITDLLFRVLIESNNFFSNVEFVKLTVHYRPGEPLFNMILSVVALLFVKRSAEGNDGHLHALLIVSIKTIKLLKYCILTKIKNQFDKLTISNNSLFSIYLLI